MGRACLIEEELVTEHVKQLLDQRKTLEVGLLLGRQAVGARDFVFTLARTPPLDDEPSSPSRGGSGGAAKKGAKKGPDGSAALDVQVDWMAEHASQVARILPGGVDVVGVYAFAPEAAFKAAQLALCSALHAVVAAATPLDSPTSAASTEPPLLLHIDSTSKRYVVRHCELQAPAGQGLNPTELKFGRVLNQFHHLQCGYEVSLRAVALEGGARLRDLVGAALAAHLQRTAQAVPTLRGALLPSAAPLVDLLGDPSMAPNTLHLLAPLTGGAATAMLPPDGSSSKGVVGEMVLEGTVHVNCYVHGREPCHRAAACLIASLCRTLKARVEILLEEAERAEDEGEGEEAARGPAAPLGTAAGSGFQRHTQLALPYKVQLPWIEGLLLNEYLLPGDSAADAIEGSGSLLGLSEDVPESQVLFVEQPTSKQSGAVQGRVWEPLAPQPPAGAAQSSARKGGSEPAGGACGNSTMVMMGATSAGVVVLAAMFQQFGMS